MSRCVMRMCSSSPHAECGKPCTRTPRSFGARPSTDFSKPTWASCQLRMRLSCARSAADSEDLVMCARAGCGEGHQRALTRGGLLRPNGAELVGQPLQRVTSSLNGPRRSAPYYGQSTMDHLLVCG